MCGKEAYGHTTQSTENAASMMSLDAAAQKTIRYLTEDGGAQAL